jgi:hypothetical protein
VPVAMFFRALHRIRICQRKVVFKFLHLIETSEARQAVGKAREGACWQGGITRRVIPVCQWERGIIDVLCVGSVFGLGHELSTGRLARTFL